MVGHATALTPVLPVPLTGPAYFVSPWQGSVPQSLIVVLQGYGTTVDLVGSTFISKTGSRAAPSSRSLTCRSACFELMLPEGPYSALAANGNLCKAKKLPMPTEFVAQNGATVTSTRRSR